MNSLKDSLKAFGLGLVGALLLLGLLAWIVELPDLLGQAGEWINSWPFLR